MPRVLVIDDSPLVLAYLTNLCTERGFELETAQSGELGVALAAQFQPDLIVCDMQMEGMTGIDVTRVLHAEHPEFPVVIFTDQSELALVVEAMRSGAYGYVIKGAPEELLVKDLEGALEHGKLLRRNRELEAANLAYRTTLEEMVREKTEEVRRLERLSAEAEKLASLGTLIAGVAHEINNPLAVINSNLSWMEQNVVRSVEELRAVKAKDPDLTDLAEVPQVIDETLACGKRIQRIVTSLKRIARKGPLGGHCSAAEALDSVRVITRQETAGRCEVQLEAAENLAPLAIAEDDFVSIVANLVTNAAHAVAPGSGKIAIKLSAQGAFGCVEVSDNGSGIDPKILGRIFDPFFTTKPPGKGTGLGLSLVRQIAQSSGGDVQVRSELGAGTTFTVRIPFAPAEADAVTAAA